jgi:signal transduction histidine kinase
MPPAILIVEDEQLFALDLEQQLSQMGYRVVGIADRFQSALDAVARLRPDLVLMDIHIKGDINGIETAAEIQAQYNLPVVFLTAHADEPTLKQAKAAQPFGYLVKPVDTPSLEATIEIALSRHQAERAMQQALEKEKELSTLKSQFVSIVSHEFRNPLSAVLFALEILERQGAQLSEENRRSQIQRAKAALKHLTQLIEDVLIVGEIESSQFSCHPLPLDIVWFCHDLVEDVQATLDPGYSILFTVNGSSGDSDQTLAHPFYYLDAKLLRHILVNLLSNAVKYSPEGGKIQFDLAYAADIITFRIRDEGVGIPPEDQNQLFTAFHRGTNVSNIPGTGLGLSIVKQCVEAHGGSIQLESHVDKGTTVIVTICQNIPYGESI